MAVKPDRPPLDEQVLYRLERNEKAKSIYRALVRDERFLASCEMSNAVAVNRLGYNDHGFTHVRIVAANALNILGLLRKKRIMPNFLTEGHGTYEDAQIMVMLGSLFHDIGNSVHRREHQIHGMLVAEPILSDHLARHYSGILLQKLKLGVLECIYSHDESIVSTSIESGVEKVADGTDCERGRARIPYKLYGKEDIHAISALAIQWVEIMEGKEKPVRVEIDMSNPAGIFQVNEVLRKKVDSSGISQHVEIVPTLNGKSFSKLDLARL